MIEIKITADNPLEALANITAYGILCMENKEVFDRAGTILDAVRSKKPVLADPLGNSVNAAPIASATPVPPTTPPASPSTVPAAPIGQRQDGNAAGATPGSTIPSDPIPVAPTTAVPTSSTPGYTLEQISKAGADLITDASKLPQLQALLQQFGIPAVTQLRSEQFGAFATALRGLGAKI